MTTALFAVNTPGSRSCAVTIELTSYLYKTFRVSKPSWAISALEWSAARPRIDSVLCVAADHALLVQGPQATVLCLSGWPQRSPLLCGGPSGQRDKSSRGPLLVEPARDSLESLVSRNSSLMSGCPRFSLMRAREVTARRTACAR